jgi:probable rRNA maturation factor
MEPPSRHVIAILNESGRRVPRSLINRAVSAALDLHGRRNQSISILISSDASVRKLNSQYRGIDEETDVLTFPGEEIPGAPLGDIAIAFPYAERQAKARGVSSSQELGYLAIHGTLHLLGFDDENDVDQAKMVSEMNRAAVKAGLKPDENWASILHESNGASTP